MRVRPVYPALSRQAHRRLSGHGSSLPVDALALELGLATPGTDRLLPKLLDGRFRFDGSDVSLWSWHRAFPTNGETIVVLDLEATNGHPERDEILEIGAVKIGPNGYEEFSRLNDPGRSIPPFIAKLTGISNDMVRGAPPLEESLLELLEFTLGATVVIQNAAFDLAFLTPRFARLGRKLQSPVVDTINLARRTLPGRRRRGLDTLCWVYGVEAQSRHRALGDARATLAVATELYYALAGGRDITLHDLHESVSKPHRAPLEKVPA